MFENITLPQVFLAIIIITIIFLSLLLFIAIKLDGLCRHTERQQDIKELKSQIVSELKANKD
jgi:hypothetical protein